MLVFTLFIISVFSFFLLNGATVIDIRKCSGPACPYAGAWMAHINLFTNTKWNLLSTKMEEATFNIVRAAHFTSQMEEADVHYVHHLSMFEHGVQKKFGFNESVRRTFILSNASFYGECHSDHNITDSAEYLALIPFYGGLPPNSTPDHHVKSIGQGNSLVDPFTKRLQTMATMCSCLQYFGHIAIGVTNLDDHKIIADILDTLSVKVRSRVHIIELSMAKPAHLPFHLLSWGQHFVTKHNCKHHAEENVAKEPHDSVFDVCDRTPAFNDGRYGRHGSVVHHPNAQSAHNSPFNEHKRSRQLNGEHSLDHHRRLKHITSSYMENKELFDQADHVVEQRMLDVAMGLSAPPPSFTPIRYVYYTESDQIVRFDSLHTFDILSKASNGTTLFLARRKEKGIQTEPKDYMGSLNVGRVCGQNSHSINTSSNDPNTMYQVRPKL